MHKANCIVTLTYSNANLPDDYSVSVRELQLFLKRLRELLARPGGPGVRIRFFACGEYGDKFGRPHYHILIFGYDFPDRVVWRRGSSGKFSFRSAELEKAWQNEKGLIGHCEVGLFSSEAAGYVARYCLKKVGGKLADTHYRRVHPLTGELVTVRPEFITMSRMPGIGDAWFQRYRCDAFPSDFLILDGHKVPVPRYYQAKLLREQEHDSLLSDDELLAVELKQRRREAAAPHAANNTPERLAVREAVQSHRATRLKRDLDSEQ